MSDQGPIRQIFHFSVFEMDLEQRELRRNGLKIKLQDQPFQLLAALLERPGKLVTREELRKHLWPADTFVDFDHSLNAAIRRLREALGTTPTLLVLLRLSPGTAIAFWPMSEATARCPTRSNAGRPRRQIHGFVFPAPRFWSR